MDSQAEERFLKLIADSRKELVSLIDERLESEDSKPLVEKYRLQLIHEIEFPMPDMAAYWGNPDEDVELLLDMEGRVRTIHMRAISQTPTATNVESETTGIGFFSSQQDIKSILGEPTHSGPPPDDEFSQKGGWDKYEYPGFSVHFEYDESQEHIVQITYSSRVEINLDDYSEDIQEDEDDW